MRPRQLALRSLQPAARFLRASRHSPRGRAKFGFDKDNCKIVILARLKDRKFAFGPAGAAAPTSDPPHERGR